MSPCLSAKNIKVTFFVAGLDSFRAATNILSQESLSAEANGAFACYRTRHWAQLDISKRVRSDQALLKQERFEIVEERFEKQKSVLVNEETQKEDVIYLDNVGLLQSSTEKINAWISKVEEKKVRNEDQGMCAGELDHFAKCLTNPVSLILVICFTTEKYS